MVRYAPLRSELDPLVIPLLFRNSLGTDLMDDLLAGIHPCTFPALCGIHLVDQVLTPYYSDKPFTYTMEGYHGQFVCIFQRPEVLHSWMADMILTLGQPAGYVVRQIDYDKFCNGIFEQGYRIALNPIYRSDGQTRWQEIRGEISDAKKPLVKSKKKG
jgi:hypothetical protein